MVSNHPDPRLVIDLPRMLTSSEVAELFGVTSSTLSRWRSVGAGPRVYWLSKTCPRYREDDVRDWLDRVAS